MKKCRRTAKANEARMRQFSGREGWHVMEEEEVKKRRWGRKEKTREISIVALSVTTLQSEREIGFRPGTLRISPALSAVRQISWRIWTKSAVILSIWEQILGEYYSRVVLENGIAKWDKSRRRNREIVARNARKVLRFDYASGIEMEMTLAKRALESIEETFWIVVCETINKSSSSNSNIRIWIGWEKCWIGEKRC